MVSPTCLKCQHRNCDKTPYIKNKCPDPYYRRRLAIKHYNFSYLVKMAEIYREAGKIITEILADAILDQKYDKAPHPLLDGKLSITKYG